ncbi:hypothetical protein ZWY2020_024640 [Hordeum vulgare]|nr:hypothetical protein ZWY2020_024640 [Hordeum vulgare]
MAEGGVRLGCTKSAEGKTDYCIAHGGGRCEYLIVLKLQGKSGRCIKHGGGKRCAMEGCIGAEGRLDSAFLMVVGAVPVSGLCQGLRAAHYTAKRMVAARGASLMGAAGCRGAHLSAKPMAVGRDAC